MNFEMVTEREKILQFHNQAVPKTFAFQMNKPPKNSSKLIGRKSREWIILRSLGIFFWKLVCPKSKGKVKKVKKLKNHGEKIVK